MQTGGRYAVRALRPADIEVAAGLLAARHRRDRGREPALPPGFEQPAATLPLLEALLAEPQASGVIAEREGRAIGFLAGAPNLASPAELGANEYPVRSLIVPYHGHAAAAEADAARVYREMYAALAAAWVPRGSLDHVVTIPAGDDALREAFWSLGFGPDDIGALREIPPLPPAVGESGLSLRRAGPADLDAVVSLARVLFAHEAASPEFYARMPEILPAWRATTGRLLADPANGYFLAERDGEPVGMVTLMAPHDFSPMATPPGTILLDQEVTLPAARGLALGAALLAHALEWAAGEGARWCVLHYSPANLPAAGFWPAQGFRPLTYTLWRHVDDRIPWATGWTS